MDDLRIIPVTHYAVGVFQGGKAIAEHNVRDFAEALKFLHKMIDFDGYEAKQVPLRSEGEIIHLLAKPIDNSYDEWLEVVVLKTRVMMYSSYYGKGKAE